MSSVQVGGAAADEAYPSPTVDVKPVSQSFRSRGLGPSGNNVLFLAADDMRPEISPCAAPHSLCPRPQLAERRVPARADGHKYMHTPNMQSLADDGYTFRRMYVQQALCAPSRTAMLTSRRPDRSRVWTIGPYFRDTTGADWITLPQFFKERGYISAGAGKIFQ